MGDPASPRETAAPQGTGRLAVTPFLFWGLFTLWAYSAYHFLRAVGRHLEICRRAALQPYAGLAPGSEAAAVLTTLERSGFRLDVRLAPALATVLATALVLIVFWFAAIVVLGLGFTNAVVVALVAASSLLFVLGVDTTLFVAARTLYVHERAWRLLDRHKTDPEALRNEPPPPELVQEWEALGNRLLLFGIFATVAGAAPTLCVWWVLYREPTDTVETALVVSVFLLAVAFHALGSRLLVDLFNARVAHQIQRRPTAARAGSPQHAAGERRTVEHDVFISYSSQDGEVADAVCAGLEEDGLKVWIAPRDILPGKLWGEAIIDAINGARCMVIIFSSHSNRSGQVIREIERAAGKMVPIIPFRIEDVPATKSMEYFLSSPHWLDALDPPVDQYIRTLTRTIRSLLDEART